jgi:hypothetical protein
LVSSRSWTDLEKRVTLSHFPPSQFLLTSFELNEKSYIFIYGGSKFGWWGKEHSEWMPVESPIPSDCDISVHSVNKWKPNLLLGKKAGGSQVIDLEIWVKKENSGKFPLRKETSYQTPSPVVVASGSDEFFAKFPLISPSALFHNYPNLQSVELVAKSLQTRGWGILQVNGEEEFQVEIFTAVRFTLILKRK